MPVPPTACIRTPHIYELESYLKISKGDFMLKIKLTALFFIVIILAGCDNVTKTLMTRIDTPETEPLKVMTYNVYIGASMDELLAITNLAEVPTEVANVYDTALASDFPSRAAAIASQIKTHRPHLIGLQEISTVRRQSPGDRIAGGSVPAETVILDYLAIVTDALQAEGLSYQVAAKVQNFDVEMPIFTAEGGIDDIRLTDYDVILARSDVAVSRITTENYANAFIVEQLLSLRIPRGYVAIDATVNGDTFRFVNTHLESFDKAVRIAQAEELIDALRNESLPIILVGDFNSPAPNSPAYHKLVAAEYMDTWQMETHGTGDTCCQDPLLRNEISEHDERIDQIFICNMLPYTDIHTLVIGDKPTDKTPTGLYPSDHAGVVAYITQ